MKRGQSYGKKSFLTQVVVSRLTPLFGLRNLEGEKEKNVRLSLVKLSTLSTAHSKKYGVARTFHLERIIKN